MKTTAIICEFNPLHTGHKRLIDFAKTFSDKVVCIMSGNFTQRGMPACCDKYLRAKHALLAGADLVVELPTIFATASAENFAYGGVTIANRMNIDYLLFGSECGNIEELTACAKKLLDDKVNQQIAQEVKKGVNYPSAVAKAVGSPILDKPNNVLAIEYIKTLLRTKSNINPVTIMREDNYNGDANQFASSGLLRTDIKLRNTYTFDYVRNDIDDSIESAYSIIAPSIISLKTQSEMAKIESVNEGIENRIFAADKSQGLDKMLEEIKSKRYTRLRIQRILLNIILNIKKDDVICAKNNSVAVKALAVKSDSATLLAKTDDVVDEFTKRADRLYYSISNSKPPIKLIKMD